MTEEISYCASKGDSTRSKSSARRPPLAQVLGIIGTLTLLACEPEPQEPEKAPPLKPAAPAVAASPEPTPKEPAPAATVSSIGLEESRFSVFAFQEVNDVEAHQAIFRANDAARTKAGVLAHLLSREVDNPKKFIVHYAAKSEKEVRDFLSSDAYRKYQEEDQVTNSNLVWFASNELIYVAESLPPQSFSLFKKFPVKDFDVFAKGIKDNLDVLKKSELFLVSVHRSSSDKNVVIVHLVAETKEALMKGYAGKVFSDARQASGATDWETPRLFVDER